MRVGIAADHRGFELKNELLAALEDVEIELIDLGAFVKNSDDDYPDCMFPLARAVANRSIDRGIAICGSGVGASLAANKIKNFRAALIHDFFSARQGFEDDDMNIICIGAQLVTFPFAMELVYVFLSAQFSGKARHMRRLAKIAQIEEMEMQNL